MTINIKNILSVTLTKLNPLGTMKVYSVKLSSDNFNYDVPIDSANTDYQAIQKWIAEGGEVIDNPPTE
jgi:hypothetical protein